MDCSEQPKLLFRETKRVTFPASPILHGLDAAITQSASRQYRFSSNATCSTRAHASASLCTTERLAEAENARKWALRKRRRLGGPRPAPASGGHQGLF